MSIQAKLEQVTKSKSGKAWRVLLGDKWYGARFDSKIDSIPIGSMIDFAIETDPKYGDWLTSWGPVVGKAIPAQGQAPVAPPRQSSSPDRWWAPFCSNTVAHAIAAGIIKEPSQIGAWVRAAKAAVEAADGQDIPF